MSRKIVNTVPIKKYCKVCHDAGKSESEYRSHFVRESHDPNSRVVCPTLLSLECRRCFKKGHTIKYCNVVFKKKPDPAAVLNAAAPEEPKGRKNVNMFDCLDSDSESDEEEKPQIKEEFPALSAVPKLTRTSSCSKNYAAALSKASVPVVSEFIPAPWVSEPVYVPKAAAPPSRRPMRSWADDSDEEDEEDLIRPANGFKFTPVVHDYENW